MHLIQNKVFEGIVLYVNRMNEHNTPQNAERSFEERFSEERSPKEHSQNLESSPEQHSQNLERSLKSTSSSHAHSSSTPYDKAPSTKMLVFSWGAVVVMAGIIFWMSANTGTNINQGLGIISAIKAFLSSLAYSIAGYDVDVSPVGHFVEYFIFGLLLINALRLHMPLSRALLCAIIIGSAYGVTDEFHQYFVPDRSCDPLDWLVDTIAVSAGAFLCRIILSRALSKKAKKNVL